MESVIHKLSFLLQGFSQHLKCGEKYVELQDELM